MSDAGQGSKEWRFYVNDMIEFAEKVQSFTDGMDQDSFVSDALTYDATLRNLELIGEAATHIPDAVRKAHPEVPLDRDHSHAQPSCAWLNCLKSAEDDEPSALEKVRNKYFDTLLKTDLHFFLGTTQQFHQVAPNPWVIIEVLPIPYELQKRLF